MQYSKLRGAGLFLALLLTACPGLGDEKLEGITGEIPENPTFEDVKPVLDEYCNECHSEPATQDAPDTIRFDVCKDEGGDLGAQNQAVRIQIRTTVTNDMPPLDYDTQPTETDRELLDKWVEQSAPCNESEVVADGEMMSGGDQ